MEITFEKEFGELRALGVGNEQDVWDIVISLVDPTPEDEFVDVSTILKHIEEKLRIAITATELSECLFSWEDYERYRRFYIPLVKMTRIGHEAVEMVEYNPEVPLLDIANHLAADYYYTYGEEANESSFHGSIIRLIEDALRIAGFEMNSIYEETSSRIMGPTGKVQSTSKSTPKSTSKKTTAKKTTGKGAPKLTGKKTTAKSKATSKTKSAGKR